MASVQSVPRDMLRCARARRTAHRSESPRWALSDSDSAVLRFVLATSLHIGCVGVSLTAHPIGRPQGTMTMKENA